MYEVSRRTQKKNKGRRAGKNHEGFWLNRIPHWRGREVHSALSVSKPALFVWVPTLRAFHEKLNHFGTDYGFSHVLQFYWPISEREAIKRIGRSCTTCQLERAKPLTQLMGDLPRERLAVFEPAFTNTSTDYFGPLTVMYGRGRSAKRYGVIFTCQTTRAVYLDIAKFLSAQDFMLVFRRFQAIYGTPKVMHSDNGTNFVR